MKHIKILLIPFLLTSLTTGCGMMNSAKSTTSHPAGKFQSGSQDEPYEPEVEDDWAFVAEEGRSGRPMERDPDRWWRNFMMSDKAKTIERSLGFE